MHIISQGFHARREAVRIAYDVALIIPAYLPAIINYNIFITRFFHSAFDHGIGHFADQGFTDVTPEFVPAVPPHRGCGGKIAEFLRTKENRG